MRNPLYFLVLALFLLGCVGRDFSTTPVEEIRTNVTTKAEIFANFGEPVEKGFDSGYEAWTYYRYTVGYALGSAGQKRLYVVFNKDGTVRSYSFSEN